MAQVSDSITLVLCIFCFTSTSSSQGSLEGPYVSAFVYKRGLCRVLFSQ